MLIAFHQNNSSNGAVPDPSSLVKGLAHETRLVVGGVYKTNLELGYMHFTRYAMRAKECMLLCHCLQKTNVAYISKFDLGESIRHTVTHTILIIMNFHT